MNPPVFTAGELLDPVAAYDRVAPVYARLAKQRGAYLDAIDQLVVAEIPPGSRSLPDVGADDADLRIRAPKDFLRQSIDETRTTEARLKPFDPRVQLPGTPSVCPKRTDVNFKGRLAEGRTTRQLLSHREELSSIRTKLCS
jgi:hypothetical protein